MRRTRSNSRMYVCFRSSKAAALLARWSFSSMALCRPSARPRIPQSPKAHGVRLIAVDRPGIGRSSPKTDRSLQPWASDMLELSNALGRSVEPQPGSRSPLTDARTLRPSGVIATKRDRSCWPHALPSPGLGVSLAGIGATTALADACGRRDLVDASTNTRLRVAAGAH